MPRYLEQIKLEVGTLTRVVVSTGMGGTRDVTGTVVMIIPAGEQPPPSLRLEPFFKAQVNSTRLVKESIPSKPSKYDRILIEVRTGRTFVFPKDKWTRFYKP